MTHDLARLVAALPPGRRSHAGKGARTRAKVLQYVLGAVKAPTNPEIAAAVKLGPRHCSKHLAALVDGGQLVRSGLYREWRYAATKPKETT